MIKIQVYDYYAGAEMLPETYDTLEEAMSQAEHISNGMIWDFFVRSDEKDLPMPDTSEYDYMEEMMPSVIVLDFYEGDEEGLSDIHYPPINFPGWVQDYYNGLEKD